MFIVGSQRILQAALTTVRSKRLPEHEYGRQRREAEVARATLYLCFSEKDSLFEALATSLVDEALAYAEAAGGFRCPGVAEHLRNPARQDMGFFVC